VLLCFYGLFSPTFAFLPSLCGARACLCNTKQDDSPSPPPRRRSKAKEKGKEPDTREERKKERNRQTNERERKKESNPIASEQRHILHRESVIGIITV
jgi:hypothetical protein